MLGCVHLAFQLNAILLNVCQKLAVPHYLPDSYSAQRGYLSSNRSVVYTSTAPNHITYGLLDGQRPTDLLTHTDHSLLVSACTSHECKTWNGKIHSLVKWETDKKYTGDSGFFYKSDECFLRRSNQKHVLCCKLLLSWSLMELRGKTNNQDCFLVGS